MSESLMHDRGRGPEIRGTRVTVYDLIPYFVSPQYTESQLCQLYQVSPEQIAAARAYVLNHFADVMAKNAAIDERHRRGMEAQNTPEFLERSRKTRQELLLYKVFIEEQKAKHEGALAYSEADRIERLQQFKEWLLTREKKQMVGGVV